MSRMLERQVNLLSALLDAARPLSSEEILERVPGYPEEMDSFRKTFARDRDALERAGVPIVREPLDPLYPEAGSGYIVDESTYRMPDPELTREEIEALSLAAAIVRLEDAPLDHALDKLGLGTLAGSDSVPRGKAVIPMAGDQRLTQLMEAQATRAPVRFLYRDKPRELEVHRLAFRNGQWYVSGKVPNVEGLRTFRLDRFASDVTVLPATGYVIEAKSPWLASWQMGDGELVPVEVWVDSGFDLFAQSQGAEVLESGPEGSRLCLRANSFPALFSFLLGFLEHAEVLTPLAVRDDYVAFIQERRDYFVASGVRVEVGAGVSVEVGG